MASATQETLNAACIDRDTVLRSIETAPKLQESMFSNVAKISDTLLVKYGQDVRLWEARNLSFVASIPGIRVPKVFDAWESRDVPHEYGPSTMAYIVMEFVDGVSLTEMWPKIGPNKRSEICSQICTALEALHQTKLDHPGPIGGGLSQGFYFTDDGAGPFQSPQEMEKWFNNRMDICKTYGRVGREKWDFTGDFAKLVMCHMDIHTKNILIDANNDVWLLDWDRAGGYPVFLEECNLRASPDRNYEDFTEQMLEMIAKDSHAAEAERLESIRFAFTTGRYLEPSLT